MEASDERRVRFSEGGFESSTAAVELSFQGLQQSVILSDEDLVFNTSKEGCTPLITRVQYRNPEDRAQLSVAPPSSITRPNYEDILKRVSVVIHQHISKCELKLSTLSPEAAASAIEQMRASKIKAFSEENYTSPQYVYHFVRAPISRLGFLYGIRKVNKQWNSPSLSEVHTFLRDLFVKAQLSAECSIGTHDFNRSVFLDFKISALDTNLLECCFLIFLHIFCHSVFDIRGAADGEC